MTKNMGNLDRLFRLVVVVAIGAAYAMGRSWKTPINSYLHNMCNLLFDVRQECCRKA